MAPATAKTTALPNSDIVSNADKDGALKDRIITHMNADHATSLVLYLRYFCGVPVEQTANARLTDMTPEHMIITSHAGRNLIPFDPPMKSLAQARERVIAMHHEALSGLGIDEVQITTWAAPNQAYQWALFVVVMVCFTTFPFASALHPDSGSLGSKIWSFGGLVPDLAILASRTAPYVLPGMVVVHGAEAMYMARSRLRRHQVPMWGGVWWAWMINTFISGIGCFRRFDEFVEEKKKAQQAKEGH